MIFTQTHIEITGGEEQPPIQTKYFIHDFIVNMIVSVKEIFKSFKLA